MLRFMPLKNNIETYINFLKTTTGQGHDCNHCNQPVVYYFITISMNIIR